MRFYLLDASTRSLRILEVFSTLTVVSSTRPLYQLCMDIPYGAPADPLLLASMVHQLPPGAVWTSFALGRMQWSGLEAEPSGDRVHDVAAMRQVITVTDAIRRA